MKKFWEEFFEQKSNELFLLQVLPEFLPGFWKRLFEFFGKPENWEFPSQWQADASWLCANPDYQYLYMMVEGFEKERSQIEDRGRVYPECRRAYPEWQFGEIYSLEVGSIACLKSNRGLTLLVSRKNEIFLLPETRWQSDSWGGGDLQDPPMEQSWLKKVTMDEAMNYCK